MNLTSRILHSAVSVFTLSVVEFQEASKLESNIYMQSNLILQLIQIEIRNKKNLNQMNEGIISPIQLKCFSMKLHNWFDISVQYLSLVRIEFVEELNLLVHKDGHIECQLSICHPQEILRGHKTNLFTLFLIQIYERTLFFNNSPLITAEPTSLGPILKRNAVFHY